MEPSRTRAPAPAPPPSAAAPVDARAGGLLAADVPRGPARGAGAGGPIVLVPVHPLPSVASAPTHRGSPRLARCPACAQPACDVHLAQPSRTASFPKGLYAGAGARVFFRSETPRRRTAWRAVWFLSRTTMPRKRKGSIVSHLATPGLTVKTRRPCGIRCLLRVSHFRATFAILGATSFESSNDV